MPSNCVCTVVLLLAHSLKKMDANLSHRPQGKTLPLPLVFVLLIIFHALPFFRDPARLRLLGSGLFSRIRWREVCVRGGGSSLY